MSTSSYTLEDLLSAVTDALIAGDEEIEPIVARYEVPRSSVEGLLGLIRRLHQTLVGVQPSARFVAHLRQDLIGTSQQGLLARVRYLPPRVQIAAGVVAVMGFILLTRKRLSDIAATTKKEESELSAL